MLVGASHKALLGLSTLPSHSLIKWLTCFGASQRAQWLVSTDFLVRLGICCSIPSDIAGGNASSFVAWMKRTGTLMSFLSSLSWVSKVRKLSLKHCSLKLILEVLLSVAVPAYCRSLASAVALARINTHEFHGYHSSRTDQCNSQASRHLAKSFFSIYPDSQISLPSSP